MTVTVRADGLRDAVRQRFSEIADDAVALVIEDMVANGPRSDMPREHMVDIVSVVESEDGERLISRTLRSPADYSTYVDDGTEAHEIRGHPLLAFTARDGSRVIVHSVQHPGTPRTGWWTDRLARWGDYVAQAMR